MTPQELDAAIEGVLAKIRAEHLADPARVERVRRLRAAWEACARRGLTPTSYRESTLELTFPLAVVEHLLACLTD